MSEDLLTGDTKDQIEGIFFPIDEDPKEWEPVVIRTESASRPAKANSLLCKIGSAIASCFRPRSRNLAAVHHRRGLSEESRVEAGP